MTKFETQLSDRLAQKIEDCERLESQLADMAYRLQVAGYAYCCMVDEYEHDHSTADDLEAIKKALE